MTSLIEARESIDKVRPILNQPGYISKANGWHVLSQMYDVGLNFPPESLSPFGRACYTGFLELVKRFIETGKAPDLGSKELPRELGYASIVVLGAENAPDEITGHERFKFRETLEYLVSQGLPLDIPDILGLTALHHAVNAAIFTPSKPPLVYDILKLGADVNYRERLGNTLLMQVFRPLVVDADLVELLLAFGADPDIPNTNGKTATYHSRNFGSEVHAVTEKWRRKRNGELVPRVEKACDGCGRKRLTLKNCSRCQVTRYCSPECQRSEWKTHKTMCIPFDSSAALTLIPKYDMWYCETIANYPPPEEYKNGALIELHPCHGFRQMKPPKGPFPRSIVVKAAIPSLRARIGGKPTQGIMINSKKQDLFCSIRKTDAPEEFDVLWHYLKLCPGMVKRAFFVAELRSPDELVVKIDRPLAEQPW